MATLAGSQSSFTTADHADQNALHHEALGGNQIAVAEILRSQDRALAVAHQTLEGAFAVNERGGNIAGVSAAFRSTPSCGTTCTPHSTSPRNVMNMDALSFLRTGFYH